jgi:hypothetical protein
MRTKDDVEQYLIDLGEDYIKLKDDVFQVVDDLPDVEDLIVWVRDPLVVFSVRLMKVPAKNREAFYAKLLELNGTMLAGAYAVEDEDVILTDTLQLENLDFNEFEADMWALAMAIHDHYPVLKAMADEGNKEDAAAE